MVFPWVCAPRLNGDRGSPSPEQRSTLPADRVWLWGPFFRRLPRSRLCGAGVVRSHGRPRAIAWRSGEPFQTGAFINGLRCEDPKRDDVHKRIVCNKDALYGIALSRVSIASTFEACINPEPFGRAAEKRENEKGMHPGRGMVSTHAMPGHSGMIIDPRIPTMPGRSTSGFRQPGGRHSSAPSSERREVFGESHEGISCILPRNACEADFAAYGRHRRI